MHVQGALTEVASSESLGHEFFERSIDSVDKRGDEHANYHVSGSNCGQLFCFTERTNKDDVDLVLEGEHEVAGDTGDRYFQKPF